MARGIARRRILTAATAIGAAGLAGIGLGRAPARALSLVEGPDGNIWMADDSNNGIVKINPSTGGMTLYTAGLSAGSQPGKLVVGPGASPDMWFTNTGGKICKITTAGLITEFPVAGSLELTGLALGPDGNLWFCDFGNNSIGKATVIDALIVGASLFPLPTSGAIPHSITNGPAGDNTLWFTELMTNKIGKITTDGSITEYTLPTSLAMPTDIALGSDGNLWFTEFNANKIGKITPGGTITEYSVPSADSMPNAIASVASDLWFTEFRSNKLAKITTGGSITEHPLPTRKSLPDAVAAGPSGTVWFVESAPRQAVKFAPSTTSFTEYTLPGGNTGTDGNQKMSLPSGITVGSDGNLWFNAMGLNKVAKITTGGTVTLYNVSSPRARLLDIAGQSGGDLWATASAQNKIVKITTGGTVTEYVIPTASAYPASIVEGPGGDIWFTEYAAAKLAKITPGGTVTEFDLTGGTGLNPIVHGLTLGPDDNLWFTAYARKAIVKVLIVAGIVVDIVEYPVGGQPLKVISGGTGSNVLWFTINHEHELGKITTAGVVSHFDVPVDGFDLALDSDGNIWYTSNHHTKVVKFVPGSPPSATEYTLNAGAVPRYIVNGPDGNLWVADFARGMILKMTTLGAVTEYDVTSD